MNESKTTVKRTSVVAALLSLIVVCLVVVKGSGQDENKAVEQSATVQWDLAVAGPSTSNLTPTGNPRMRKEPNAAFGREAFVLEQHLDALGANGWELVAVAGPPTDPAYYFKRPKLKVRNN